MRISDSHAAADTRAERVDWGKADEAWRVAHDDLVKRVTALTGDLVRADARLRHVHDALARAENLSALGLLAASAAHQIRDPLSGVISLATALREREIAPPRTNEYLDAILDGLERIRLAAQGLLDFSRQRAPRRASFDTGEMVESCLRLLSPVIRAKDLRLELRIPPGHTLFADRSQIMQAFVNVVLNAVHAAPAGSRLTVAAERSDHRVGLRVTDEGAGFQAPDSASLYDAFFTTKLDGDGPGLGLAVTHSILRAHGGELAIESSLGAGTSVTLWICDRAVVVTGDSAAPGSPRAPG